MATFRSGIPTVSMENVTKTPKPIFEKLALPKFRQTSYDDDDPRHGNRVGQDSSHLTITGPSGLSVPLRSSCTPMAEIKGAVIYCDGAIERGKPRKFVPMSISPLEAAFHAHDQPCSIPSMIGLPIWMRPYHHDPTINRSNSVATWLHIIGDLDAEGFGFATKTWLDSAVVMRTDSRNLLPQHLEALAFFCKHVFEEVIGDEVGSAGLSNNAGTREVQKKTFRKLASRKGFLQYYETYCLEKAVLDKFWRDLPSPFDNELLDGERQMKDTTTADQEATGGSAPRRSGRPTRIPLRVSNVSLTTTSPTEEEVRGRSRKRRFADDD